jgi:hypothetical protein
MRAAAARFVEQHSAVSDWLLAIGQPLFTANNAKENNFTAENAENTEK